MTEQLDQNAIDQAERERQARVIWDEEDYGNAIRAMSRDKERSKLIPGLIAECRQRLNVDPFGLE